MAICMESRDWKIRVTEENGYIDGKSVKFLAYDVENREYKENSRLILENVNEDFYKAFSEEIRKFYYVENPYFGKCIAKKEKYAVYEAENIDFPGKHKGAVFSGYQLRAYIEPPLIICNHKVTQIEDDRDRTYFYNSEIGDCIKPVILSLSPEEALNVLEKLEPFWAVNKKMEYEWRWPIRHLICRISEDKESQTGTNQSVAFFFMMFLRYRAFFFSLASCHLCGIPFFKPHCKKSHQDWN